MKNSIKTIIMSGSIHITTRNFKGLIKKDPDEQLNDPKSEFRQWARKFLLKEKVKKASIV